MIVVGYSADRYGTAALEHGITEAKPPEHESAGHQRHPR